MTKTLLLTLALAAVTSPTPARAGAVSRSGEQLGTALDAMDVEHLWLPGDEVDWQTGAPLGPPPDGKRHTHCSAFVAAASERLGVYILRYPDHSQTLLANAQFAWLSTPAAAANGWQPVTTDLEAQRLANDGQLVVVAFASSDTEKPGHIAVVRPSLRSDADIQSAGPEIIQAGTTNYNATTVENGFKGHAGAWSRHLIRYSWHPLTWPQ